MLDVGRHPNIELMAYSEVESVEGSAGCFKVTVRKKARYVNSAKCTGCGACTEVCPTIVPDLYNEGHATRKAIYSWFAQGIPSTHTIDTDHCRVLPGEKMRGLPEKMRGRGHRFRAKDQVIELEVGAIIAANGIPGFDPGRIPEYRYQRSAQCGHRHGI
jgi:heterodisulfide reductase subunit A-like polyferredoxin